MSEVYLNGKFIGNIENPEEFRVKIIEERRDNKLSQNTNIMYNTSDDNLYIESGKGRIRRPVIIVKEGKSLLTEAWSSTNIYFRKADKSKVDKVLKKHNYPRKWPSSFFINDYKQDYNVRGNELEMSVPKADVDGYLKLFKSYGVKGRGENSKEKASRKGSSSSGRKLPTWPGR